MTAHSLFFRRGEATILSPLIPGNPEVTLNASPSRDKDVVAVRADKTNGGRYVARSFLSCRP